jgi:CheY-like chemotaxis protein/anti-sigma regulatory factor (Ser/Thr protein kinase)
MHGEKMSGDLRMVPDEWIEHNHSTGRRLLALINDILDLTKVEAGRMELRLEPLELGGAVTEVLAGQRPFAEKKHLRVCADVPAIEVLADRIRLRQILDNLLSNAVKFTPDGGTVSVTASSTVTMALISVTDTGAGIAEDDLERVFQEFQQVGDLTARHSGTGLGLALTRRLVQAHGGKIEVRSEVGSGTTFTIHLPLVHEEHAVPDRPRAVTAGTAGRPGGILVIEDEPGAARLLRTYLEDAGYSVELAATGEAGLEAAHNFAPQAIVLDVLLPGIDGWEVLRRLKRDPAVRDIPVVIVTVVDEQEVGLDLGAVDYFVKPIDRELLLDRLSTLALIPPSVAPSSKVLVIDDDPGTRQIVTTNLTQRGYEVVTAATGVEGLRVARSQQFDLIICDLVMPDMDGYSVIAALNADFGSPHCPIVVFTAHDVADTDRGRLEGRVLGVVQKGEAAQAGLREWVEWITNQPDAPGFSTVPQPVQAVSARTQGAS